MGDIQTTKGIYVGKEFKSNGTGKAGEWQRFGFKFKPDLKAPNGFNITVFMPWKNKMGFQPADLKEGVEYAISYRESEFTAPTGELAKSKTAVGFYPADGLPKGDVTSKIYATPSAVPLDKFPHFKEKYVVQVPKEKQSSTHMIGAFVKTYLYKEKDWQMLIGLANNTFEEKKSE